MDKGRTLFAQLMDFLQWSTFARFVVRYDGDHRLRSLNCAEQYRAMAFAQLTYRESLRDIETCLAAQTAKHYRMAFASPSGARRWQMRRISLVLGEHGASAGVGWRAHRVEAKLPADWILDDLKDQPRKIRCRDT